MPTTVLLIEEDEDNRALCRTILEHSGFQVLQAADCVTGIDVARDGMPALIVVDLTVPGRHGVDGIQLLRSDSATARIPVVALTDGNDRDRDHARAAGCHGYLPKRVAPERKSADASRSPGEHARRGAGVAGDPRRTSYVSTPRT